MGNLFSKGDAEISWLETLVVALVPNGQLIVRAGSTLRGSLDKWWLLFPLFMIPPFSIVIALLMKFFNIIKPGQGKGAAYDLYMLIPLAVKLFFPMIMPIF